MRMDNWVVFVSFVDRFFSCAHWMSPWFREISGVEKCCTRFCLSKWFYDNYSLVVWLGFSFISRVPSDLVMFRCYLERTLELKNVGG